MCNSCNKYECICKENKITSTNNNQLFSLTTPPNKPLRRYRTLNRGDILMPKTCSNDSDDDECYTRNSTNHLQNIINTSFENSEGVDEFIMNKLIESKEVEIKENTLCAVCFDKTNKLIINIKCSHTFHKKCIIEWLKTNKLCPVCRVNI